MASRICYADYLGFSILESFLISPVLIIKHGTEVLFCHRNKNKNSAASNQDLSLKQFREPAKIELRERGLRFQAILRKQLWILICLDLVSNSSKQFQVSRSLGTEQDPTTAQRYTLRKLLKNISENPSKFNDNWIKILTESSLLSSRSTSMNRYL